MTLVPQPANDQLTRFANRSFSQFGLNHRVYCVPVDWDERERIEELDDVLGDLLPSRTVFPAFPTTNDDDDSDESDEAPEVLDCGCGHGVWIDRLIEESPVDLEVTGIDICFPRVTEDPDEPEDDNEEPDVVQEYVKRRWNLNARFRDDRSEGHLKQSMFDLINSRILAEGINTNRWDSYVGELFLMLKPGGWLQMVELDLHIQSWNGRLDRNGPLTRWWQWYSYTMGVLNRNPRIGRELQQLLVSKGLTRVHGDSVELPLGAWRADRVQLGEKALKVMQKMLASLTLWPFLQGPGAGRNMTLAEYQSLIRGATEELHDPSFKLYIMVHYAYGRRPRTRPAVGSSSRRR